jgi:hypothetical protein
MAKQFAFVDKLLLVLAKVKITIPGLKDSGLGVTLAKLSSSKSAPDTAERSARLVQLWKDRLRPPAPAPPSIFERASQIALLEISLMNF